MSDRSELILWVVVWIVAAGLILIRVQRRREVGVGLVLAYLLSFWLLHWPGAAIYLSPGYSNPERDPALVAAGFRLSAYGVIAFGAGVMLAPLLMRIVGFPPATRTVRRPEPSLAIIYLLIGVLCFTVLLPIAARLPTITSLVAAGWSLAVVGLALKAWQAWRQGRRRAFAAWLVGALFLPFLSIVTQGLVTYGIAALFAVLAFVATFVRPNWRFLALILLFSFGALSFYVTYMRDRASLRETIWGGQSMSKRVERVYQSVTEIEWFDYQSDIHLARIEQRLNQNWLVGAAAEHLGAGREDYAQGRTLWQAFTALVPRAFWPDKPVVAGGQGLVNHYTGIKFSEGTSVGMGQVFEFYVNFRALGVVLGFVLLGLIVAALDLAAGDRLSRGDWQGFTLWYLPGLAFLNAGGSLVEITASAAAAVVLALWVNGYLLPHLRGKRVIVPAPGEAVPAPSPSPLKRGRLNPRP